MTTRGVSVLRTLLPTALVIAVLVVPVFASPSQYNGPLYTSPGHVHDAQLILTSEGYLHEGRYTPGVLDAHTVQALRDFQYDHFIPNNGVLDQDTMAELTTHRRPLAPTFAENGLGTGSDRSAAAGTSSQRSAAAGASSQRAAAGGGTSQGAAGGRSMPVTASAVPTIAVVGTILLGGGLLVLRRRRA